MRDWEEYYVNIHTEIEKICVFKTNDRDKCFEAVELYKQLITKKFIMDQAAIEPTYFRRITVEQLDKEMQRRYPDRDWDEEIIKVIYEWTYEEKHDT